MAKQRASRFGLRVKKLAGSGVVWVAAAVLILIGLGVAMREKGRGDLTKLKTELGAAPPSAAAAAPQPGGMDAVVLSRTQNGASDMPEFVSATLLPGRGMNVFQIMAYVPSKGVIPLLASPSVADADRRMTGEDNDLNGAASLMMGGAIEIPWASQLAGASVPGGTTILANWQGRGLTLPINGPGPAAGQVAEGGLMLRRTADSVKRETIPDGESLEGLFHAGDFDGHWPSRTDIKTMVTLNGRSIEMTVIATNAGNEPEPMGIGWRPRFVIPSGDRAQAMLRIPSAVQVEANGRENNNGTGMPTGKLSPVDATGYDFSRAPLGMPLRSTALNDTFVHLKTGALDNGAQVELADPASGYGMRMTALSPTIRAIHVTSNGKEALVSINPQTNYDDPLGREWGKDEDTGIVILQPGESLQWKIRLELFVPGGQAAQQR